MTIKGIRIVSDGTFFGTKVYDCDGADITEKLQLSSIRFDHKAGREPIAELRCLCAGIEASGVDAEFKAFITP